MRRGLLVVLVVLVAGAAAWLWFGGAERVTAARIESTLVEQGVPPPMADCMGERMAARLSLAQLRKLERLGPQDGETVVPRSPGQILTRLRRVDDPEAVRIATGAAAWCAFRFR